MELRNVSCAKTFAELISALVERGQFQARLDGTLEKGGCRQFSVLVTCSVNWADEQIVLTNICCVGVAPGGL